MAVVGGGLGWRTGVVKEFEGLGEDLVGDVVVDVEEEEDGEVGELTPRSIDSIFPPAIA